MAKQKQPRKQRRANLSPSRQPEGESLTPQPLSALSNNDPFTPSEPSPLFIYHKSVLTLKCKIIRLLAFLFYRPEEYGLVNYICHAVEAKFNREIAWKIGSDRYKGHEYRLRMEMEGLLIVSKEELIARFHEAENNLKKLKQSSKMIIDKESDTVTINNNFFNMLSAICEGLLKKNQEKQKQLADTEQVTCKNCRRKRPLYEVKAEIKCHYCNSMEVVAKDSTQTRAHMRILEEQITRVMRWKAEIDELDRKENQRQAEEKNRNYQSNRVTDIDKDIERAMEFISREKERVRDYVPPFDSYKVKVNAINIENAEREFAPRRVYKRIGELAEARSRRNERKFDSLDMIL